MAMEPDCSPVRRHYHWLCRLVSPFTQPDLQCPNDLDWTLLWRLADRTHVVPELQQGVMRLGIARALPDDMQTALAAYAQLNEVRCALLREQMHEITAALTSNAIDVVWLKGAALLTNADWKLRARHMNDLDLWLPEPSQHAQAIRILTGLGYTIKPGTSEGEWNTQHQLAPRMHPQRIATLEVHRHLVRPACAMLLPDQPARQRIVWQSWEQQRIGLLDLEDRISQSFVQCSVMAVPPLMTGIIRLMKLVDLLRLLHDANTNTLPDQLVSRVMQSPYQNEAGLLMSKMATTFDVPNPFPENPEYYRAVIAYLNNPAGYAQWLKRTGRQVPKNWRTHLAHPASWPEKIVRRLRMLQGRSY